LSASRGSHAFHLDNDSSDEGEDEEDDDSQIEFLLRENDKYPLLPNILDGTPLDKMKKILREFVCAVRSKSTV